MKQLLFDIAFITFLCFSLFSDSSASLFHLLTSVLMKRFVKTFVWKSPAFRIVVGTFLVVNESFPMVWICLCLLPNGPTKQRSCWLSWEGKWVAATVAPSHSHICFENVFYLLPILLDCVLNWESFSIEVKFFIFSIGKVLVYNVHY
jgi:hypothetical protein